ncbi:unnamed protein product [Urochloa humidicola]
MRAGIEFAVDSSIPIIRRRHAIDGNPAGNEVDVAVGQSIEVAIHSSPISIDDVIAFPIINWSATLLASLSSPAPLSRSIHLRLLTCPDYAASFAAGSRAAAAFSPLCSPWHDDSAPPDREVIQLQNSTRREGVPADRWH